MPCADAAPRCRPGVWRKRSAYRCARSHRDVADLQLSGAPIEGEAGVGHVLRKGADIPPLMFNAEELEALVVGSRFVRFRRRTSVRGRERGAAQNRGGAAAGTARTHATLTYLRTATARPHRSDIIDRLHTAIAECRVLRPDYRDESGRASTREVEPLCPPSGAVPGRSARGATCARISAASVPTASPTSSRPAQLLSKRGARLIAYVRAMGGDTDLV